MTTRYNLRLTNIHFMDDRIKGMGKKVTIAIELDTKRNVIFSLYTEDNKPWASINSSFSMPFGQLLINNTEDNDGLIDLLLKNDIISSYTTDPDDEEYSIAKINQCHNIFNYYKEYMTSINSESEEDKLHM